MSLEPTPDEIGLSDESAEESPARMDGVGFADSLAAVGCKMRDRFVSTFSTAWDRLPHAPHIDMNFTSVMSDATIRVKNRVSSFVDSMMPSFSIDQRLFDDVDNVSDFFGSERGGDKFMGLYSVEDLTSFIRDTVVGKGLVQQKVDDWYIDVDLSDCFHHYVYLRRRSHGEREKYLGFLIVKLGSFPSFGKIKDPNMLNVRWFSLQNPDATFSAERPRLPGQRYPGTKLARACFAVICELAVKSERDGIINAPEHFHNAFLYENFMFIDPADQGRFERITHDLAVDIRDRGLAAVSWAVYLGFLRRGGVKELWSAYDQVFPLSGRMQAYFQTRAYLDAVRVNRESSGPYEIEWTAAEQFCLSSVVDMSEEDLSRQPV